MKKCQPPLLLLSGGLLYHAHKDDTHKVTKLSAPRRPTWTISKPIVDVRIHMWSCTRKHTHKVTKLSAPRRLIWTILKPMVCVRIHMIMHTQTHAQTQRIHLLPERSQKPLWISDLCGTLTHIHIHNQIRIHMLMHTYTRTNVRKYTDKRRHLWTFSKTILDVCFVCEHTHVPMCCIHAQTHPSSLSTFILTRNFNSLFGLFYFSLYK